MYDYLPLALAALVAAVAWGVGGYQPWAMLLLSVQAVVLTGWVVAHSLFTTSAEQRKRNLAVTRARRRSFFRRSSTHVEITPPPDSFTETERTTTRRSVDANRFFLLGYPFRRTGAGALALALTLWMAGSIMPIPARWLSLLSPKALSLRAEIATLIGNESVSSAPWSVSPFLTFQDVLLWLAYAMIFWVTFQIAGSSRAVRRLTFAIVVVGIGSGVYGLFQWLSLLGASFNDGSAPPGGLMATGSFGNRNHYALFQEMALLTGLGWLLLHWNDSERHARDRVRRQEAKARTGLFALGVGCIGLSLLFSLSRSGITFAVAGAAALLFLTRNVRRDAHTPSRAARPVVGALVLCLIATALWIGIDPVLNRFELVSQELNASESGRAAVWRDSVGAFEDFWLTGSGSSSFQYVFPIYRSFGGRRFYSWAHNDYLQIAIELGLPGLILAALMLAWIARRANRIRTELSRGNATTSRALLHAGYCAAAITVALHSFTDFGLHLPANAVLFSIIVGVVSGLTTDHRPRRKTKLAERKLRRSPPATA